MKILHVLAPAPHGGLERVVQMLSVSQAESGASVAVAGVVAGGDSHPFFERLDGTRVEALPVEVPDRAWRREVAAVAELLAERGPDVLHTHGYRSDVLGRLAARRPRTPVVSTAHGFTGGGTKNRLYEWLQVASYRRVGEIVAVSRPLHRRLARSRVPGDRLHLVRNAWRPSAGILSRDDARIKLGLSSEDVVIGWVGRLGREKGPDIALDALGRVPDVRLAFIGGGSMEAELRETADATGIADRVSFEGWLPDAGSYLKAFDALLLSSRTEGTPIILLEALAAAVPIVATEVGGVPDVVRGGREALLASADDPEALARAVQTCVEDPVAAADRAAAGSIRLADEFGVGPWVDRYRAIYAKALGESE